MAYLEIATRDGVQHITLDRDQLSVGRLAYNDVVLPFAQISRQHAELRRIKGQWWIADLHSTNGLHFDSRRISEHALQDGDQILLAPGITLRFLTEDVPSQAPEAQPTVYTGAVQPAPAPPRPSKASYAPSGSRSPYADDEAPFVPPGMRTSGPVATPSAPLHGRTMPSAPSSNGAQPSYGPSADPAGSQPPASGGRGGTPPAPDSGDMGGYPVPNGPVSKLLHVCQTCGQLTAPDAIYCQSCHQPLARECPACRLNLLPIQERCPRCHTPNAGYVGKTRRTQPPA